MIYRNFMNSRCALFVMGVPEKFAMAFMIEALAA